MEVKKIVEGMTAPQVAQVIDDNFKAQYKILEEDIAKQNNVIGVSEYKDFSEAEAVNVGDVRKYNGLLYECVEATTGAFDASKWKKSSFKAETEKKLSELGSKVKYYKIKGIEDDKIAESYEQGLEGIVIDGNSINVTYIAAWCYEYPDDGAYLIVQCIIGENEYYIDLLRKSFNDIVEREPIPLVYNGNIVGYISIKDKSKFTENNIGRRIEMNVDNVLSMRYSVLQKEIVDCKNDIEKVSETLFKGVNEVSHEIKGEIDYYNQFGFGYDQYMIGQQTEEVSTSVNFNTIVAGPIKALEKGIYTCHYSIYINRNKGISFQTSAYRELIYQGVIEVSNIYQSYDIFLDKIYTLNSGDKLAVIFYNDEGKRLSILGSSNNTDIIFGTPCPCIFYNKPITADVNVNDITWYLGSISANAGFIAVQPILKALSSVEIVKMFNEKDEMLSGKLKELSKETLFYVGDSMAAKAYNQGLRGVFVDTSIVPITYLDSWCYYNEVIDVTGLYVRCKIKGSNDFVYLLKNKNFEEIIEDNPIPLEYQGNVVGYISIKDKESFTKNSIAAGEEMNIKIATSQIQFVALKDLENKTNNLENKIKEVEDAIPSLEIELQLPSKLYAVVGDTLQLFYRGIVKAVNPYNYDIAVSCNKGMTFPRYWTYTPSLSDVGSTELTIYAKNEKGEILGRATTVVETVASPTSPSSKINVFTFGDSLTSSGIWVGEANRRLTKTNSVDNIQGKGISNVSFCGSKLNNQNDATTPYFGVGGWTWGSYLMKGSIQYRIYVNGVSTASIGAVYTNNGYNYTIAEVNITNGTGNILLEKGGGTPSSSGTLTKVSGNGDETITFTSYETEQSNPLWDSDNNKMSFKPYVERYGNGKIDAVYVLLTWNGQAAWKQYSVDDISGHIANAKTFANTLHNEYPNAKLKIMGIQMPSLNGGLGANYGSSGNYSERYGLYACAFSYNKALQDLCNLEEYNDFCEYVDVASQFDSENNMPEGQAKVNRRSSKMEYVGTNGVHPSTAGYYQIGDAVYRNIVANFCQ